MHIVDSIEAALMWPILVLYVVILWFYELRERKHGEREEVMR